MSSVTQRSIRDYQDMLDMPRPVSLRHRPMPIENRAAQFAPFAALTSYGDLIDESSRYVAEKEELDEEQQQDLDGILAQLQMRAAEQPSVSVVYFVPDARKTGGTYEGYRGRFRRLDAVQRLLFFCDGMKLRLEDVRSVVMEEVDLG